jgi:transposase
MSTKPKSKPLSVISHKSTEVVPKPTRRKFTLEYKLRIVQEANACNESGQLGALLRCEGLYSSSLSQWRRQFKEAGQKALTPKKRGRKPDPTAALRDELDKLKGDKARLEHKLATAHKIIEVQKKVSDLLGISLQEQEGEP